MHIHLGVASAFITFLQVIIIGIFWRIAAMHLSGTSIGQAMAVAY